LTDSDNGSSDFAGEASANDVGTTNFDVESVNVEVGTTNVESVVVEVGTTDGDDVLVRFEAESFSGVEPRDTDADLIRKYGELKYLK
jgi:hypothetical protein